MFLDSIIQILSNTIFLNDFHATEIILQCTSQTYTITSRYWLQYLNLSNHLRISRTSQQPSYFPSSSSLVKEEIYTSHLSHQNTITIHSRIATNIWNPIKRIKDAGLDLLLSRYLSTLQRAYVILSKDGRNFEENIRSHLLICQMSKPPSALHIKLLITTHSKQNLMLLCLTWLWKKCMLNLLLDPSEIIH